MYEIPAHIRAKINRYQPVDMDGITFYPIRVKEYSELLIATPAIEFVQRSLPVAMLSRPLLDAFYGMDMAAVESGGTPEMLFRAIAGLVLALRIGEGMPMEQRLMMVQIVPQEGKRDRLKHLVFPTPDGALTISPLQFQAYRVLIGAQNGIEIPSDNANPDIIEAEREAALRNAQELDILLEDQIQFVATLCHVNEQDVDEWPILKLKKKEGALTQVIRYLLCGNAEASGAKWDKGNPYPHPYYKRKESNSAGLKNLRDILPESAEKAVGDPGARQAN